MSAFVWIDHSEKQRRQILDVMDLFREKDTRDELGLAGIRDTFSDILFPGTSALQTRARYFFFIPWMYLRFEQRRLSSAEVAAKVRRFELDLIDKLMASNDLVGTIGRVARTTLQRFPSSIYWFGLKQLGVRAFPGTQSDYHRTFDRRNARPSAVRMNDDGDIVDRAEPAWHLTLPAAPEDFPSRAGFDLSQTEARYLSRRVIELHPQSLFAFFLANPYIDADVEFAWDHPATANLSDDLIRTVTHARNFSEVMHGASILYNAYLAEFEPPRSGVIAVCDAMYANWCDVIRERRAALEQWDRADFWTLLARHQYSPSALTRNFVDEWCRRVLAAPPERLKDASSRELLFHRESQIKGALARSANRSALQRWNGEAGLRPLSYRWGNASVILRDIARGLEGEDA